MNTFSKISAIACTSILLLTGCSTDAESQSNMTTASSVQVITQAPSKKAEVKKEAPAKKAAPETKFPVKKAAPETKAPAKKVIPKTKKTKPPVKTGTALAKLNTLEVNDRSLGGYKRAAFGSSWDDVDNNGCDTRNDILAKYMTKVSTSDGCKVKSGVLKDSYTLQTKAFSSDRSGGGIDIDHVVALSAGWKTGMGNTSAQRRLAFANDPLNLLPVDAGLNRFKSDKDASEWIPSYRKSSYGTTNPAVDCPYVARQIAVKSKYQLWVTSAEKNAIASVLAKCPSQSLPTGGLDISRLSTKAESPSMGQPPKTAKPAPSKTSKPATKSKGSDPDMGSCSKAKAAGYGPYHKGDVEYGFYRDGDGDGTVCE